MTSQLLGNNPRRRSLEILLIFAIGFLIFLVASMQTEDLVGIPTTSFPDPTGIYSAGTYYAYATSSNGYNIPLAESVDGDNYRIVADALPGLPRWAKTGIWAPHITHLKNNYLLYFSAIDNKTNLRCVGVAESTSPQDPFLANQEPVVCNDAAGGLIDPAVFTDTDGKHYLLYKNDGNSINVTSNLWIQTLSDDGNSVTGDPRSILANITIPNPPNNGPLVKVSTIENPYLLKAPDGTYILLFSGNNYATADYFTGYASAASLFGPYQYQGPVLTTTQLNGSIVGPGGAEVFTDPGGKQTMLLHGWVNGIGGANGGSRKLYVLNFSWRQGHIPVAN